MSAKIDVLVVAASPDVQAHGIAAAVRTSSDMTLAANRVLTTAEAMTLLRAMPRVSPCALVLVGTDAHDEELERLPMQWHGLVLLRVHVIGNRVEIAVHDVALDGLLRAMRELIGHRHKSLRERYLDIGLHRGSHPRSDRFTTVGDDRS